VLRAAAGFAALAVATRASFFSVVDLSVVADFATALSEPAVPLDVDLLDLSPGSGLSASAVVSPASGRRGGIVLGADLSTGTRSGGTGLSSAVDCAGDGAGGESVDFALGAGTVVDGVAVALDDGDVGAGDGVAAVGGTVGRDATDAFDGERVMSRRYGALIATATANTISTSSARNHVVAKIERGAVSS
jgi:hypothetical protein